MMWNSSFDNLGSTNTVSYVRSIVYYICLLSSIDTKEWKVQHLEPS
jgi:hypothetical protein